MHSPQKEGCWGKKLVLEVHQNLSLGTDTILELQQGHLKEVLEPARGSSVAVPWAHPRPWHRLLPAGAAGEHCSWGGCRTCNQQLPEPAVCGGGHRERTHFRGGEAQPETLGLEVCILLGANKMEQLLLTCPHCTAQKSIDILVSILTKMLWT